jgi:hypothetical protein
MRSVVIFFILIMSFQKPVSAQERDTLVEIATPGRSGALPEQAGIRMSPGSTGLPVLPREFNSSSEFQMPALTNMNFSSPAGWKIETAPFFGFGSIHWLPFMTNGIALYGQSLWEMNPYSYGVRAYRVNDKLYVGTAGISDKNYNTYLQKSGYLRQTNYGSSLFVGYKFSEKFSISAGFTIHPNGDPLNRNQQMMNGGILP